MMSFQQQCRAKAWLPASPTAQAPPSDAAAMANSSLFVPGSGAATRLHRAPSHRSMTERWRVPSLTRPTAHALRGEARYTPLRKLGNEGAPALGVATRVQVLPF